MANEKHLIYKEDLLDEVLGHFGIDLAYLGEDMQFCQEAIDMAPAVDPVHAAGACYCQECRHWEECDALYGKEMVCTNQGCMKVAKRPNDFCSRGERR